MYGRAQLWSDTAVPDTLGIWYIIRSPLVIVVLHII